MEKQFSKGKFRDFYGKRQDIDKILMSPYLREQGRTPRRLAVGRALHDGPGCDSAGSDIHSTCPTVDPVVAVH